MIKIPEEFNDIRPYQPEEIPQIVDELTADPQFRAVAEGQLGGIPFDVAMAQARACRSLLDFQKLFSYPLMTKLIQTLTKGTTLDCDAITPGRNYTFMSNHRDIVLDSGFLCKLLMDSGFENTVEIAIGDNLLSIPWIFKLVRLNKAFIVQRSLQGRDKLMASMKLGRYMQFAINEKAENIWIAQRQGRAKNSDDRTQDTVLKMMAFGGEGSIIDRLAGLHIVPLSISYEYDPCDYLKAKEFQQRRDNPDYRKTKQEDVVSMQVGITGYKGHVHYSCAPCIDTWLRTLDLDAPRNEIYNQISAHIDHEIHSHYRLYAGNYIAYDLLARGERFANLYTEEQAADFQRYISTQMAKIDLENKDVDYLYEQMLLMYANPLKNYLRAAEQKALNK